MNDDNEKVKNFFKGLGWILALILLGFIAGIYLSPSASGFDWIFGKQTYCQFGNFTNSSDCDISWCNNVLSNETQSCIFDNIDYLCKCSFIIEQQINETNTTNSILLSSNYYNKTEIDNQTDEIKKYIENLTLTLRNNMLDRIDNVSAPIYYGNDGDNTSQSNTPWYTWVLVAGIIMGGLFIISSQKKNNNIPLDASRKRQITQRPQNFSRRPQNMVKSDDYREKQNNENQEDEVD